MEIFLDSDVNKILEIKEPIKTKHMPYWTAEVYGFGKQIREFAGYPYQLPLCINTDHGASSTGILLDSEINSDAPIQFYHVPESVTEWRKRFSKPCYLLHSPFVFYRKTNNINPSTEAKGTLAYPAHTTPDIDDVSDIEKYIADLKALPDQFQPVLISLHYHDINKGMHKLYLKHGFRVFTAGHPLDYRFINNFYDILKNCRYSTSNMMMSCLFYSVEMGIPHFIYGNDPVLVNTGDANLKKGHYNFIEMPKVRMVTEMFQGPLDTISEKQAGFVKHELGLIGHPSRSQMKYLLYKAYFLYEFRKKYQSLKWLVKKNLRAIKKYPGYTSFILKKTFTKDKEVEGILSEKKIVTLKELYKLKSEPHVSSSNLLGKKISVTDSFWYLHSLKEIFAEEVYRFAADNDSPYILDCGSNIGLSVIYFKRLFPNSRIVAFEPDKQIFGLLKNNLEVFGYTDVQLENKAIWKEDTELNFSAMGSLGGKISNEASAGSLNGQVVSVTAVRLKHYLDRKVDFLKMDIEGPELQVLRDCAKELKNVQHLFVEYHSDPEKQQELDELLSLLREAGFRVYIKEAWNNLPYPFLRKDYRPFYDLQLNIFAYRA